MNTQTITCPGCGHHIAVAVAVHPVAAPLRGRQVAAQERVGAPTSATPSGAAAPPRDTAGSGGCVQATPQHRCPECGLATRLLYGTKKTGQQWQGQKCTNRQCPVAQLDKFLPGTFRLMGQAS